MKIQSFQKKRRPTGGGLFVSHAKTKRRKKQRVAASADLGSEVPNLGVARALFVILVLHVAAIAAIFIHNRVTDDSLITTSDDETTTTSRIGGSAKNENEPTVIRKNEEFYFLSTGDTYEKVAKAHGVDVMALRAPNNNKKLRTGDTLRIPARTIVVVPPIEVEKIEGPSEQAMTDRGKDPIEIEVPLERPAKLVKPIVRPPVAVVTPSVSYHVKKGDSLWGIARRHKVSLDSLLKTNGITNAKTLRIGMNLRIPGN
ncbi:MAG: LysM peptidoglycan-binding domain-containing protein [Roseibacillus sp.]|nr:LysM peptidoglycan-binding domain-containing protein [Roseibacillus sp.]